ncbi:hypothetical protein H839_08159 [Parageobacillus genomosp. 1]|uniref:Uncharacterized protein n=1 Tax=Parageobacillus genomosp. 1 TaxID=1295642 RepID=A0ABC9VGG6_9BACL|nr:hypothetical protein [Parageobacillus genomosp. 1]EZP77591.1 hypothetical protein H839_08159 [Parageobacillus genomosp. 1]
MEKDIPKIIPLEYVDERFRKIAELSRKKREYELKKDYMAAAKLSIELIKLKKQVEGVDHYELLEMFRNRSNL